MFLDCRDLYKIVDDVISETVMMSQIRLQRQRCCILKQRLTGLRNFPKRFSFPRKWIASSLSVHTVYFDLLYSILTNIIVILYNLKLESMSFSTFPFVCFSPRLIFTFTFRLLALENITKLAYYKYRVVTSIFWITSLWSRVFWQRQCL